MVPRVGTVARMIHDDQMKARIARQVKIREATRGVLPSSGQHTSCCTALYRRRRTCTQQICSFVQRVRGHDAIALQLPVL